MAETRGEALAHGLVAGLIGYGVVVLVIGMANLLQGESVVHTPEVLGNALFFGGSATEAEGGAVAAVIAFNGIHLAASLLVGFAVSWLLYETERHHALWYVIMMILIAGFIYSVVLVGMVGAEMAGVVTWQGVLLANALWAVAMGGYLWWVHRGLAKRLSADPEA